MAAHDPRQAADLDSAQGSEGPYTALPAPARLGNAAEGLINFFTEHRTAHNLLMVLILVIGLLAFDRLRRQFFPDVDIPRINVTVAYQGASALQVDEGIVARIEPDLRQIADVRRVFSTSRDGAARIQLEFPVNTDLNTKLTEVQRVVEAATLPENASDPSVSKAEFRETVTHYVLTGPVRHEVLASYGQDLRAQIERQVAADVTLFGAPEKERRVEVDQAKMEAAGLTLVDVAGLVSGGAGEVPAGAVLDTGVSLQTGQVPTAPEDIEALALTVRPDGSVLQLRDVASVLDTSDPDATYLLYLAGSPAIDLNIERSVTGDSIDIRNTAADIVAAFAQTLPHNINVVEWGNSADLIESRLNLLQKNGFWGLVIVMVLLFIFMGGRSAFWVAMGIPVAIMGTFAVMLGMGQTVNMISLFAILLSLGIIVDDAIVVAEHADDLHRQGLSPSQAARRAGVRMSGPVMASSLTTVGAFAPLFVISGEFGSFVIAFPLVVIAVIIASLIECFLILPGHMKSALAAKDQDGDPRPVRGPISAVRVGLWVFRKGIDQGFDWFRDKAFRPFVELAVAYRYVTLVLGAVIMLGAYGLQNSGKIETQFSPDVEFNNLFAAFEMNANANLDDTIAFCTELDRTLNAALSALEAEDALIIAACYTGLNFLDPTAAAQGQDPSAIATLAVEFVNADQRPFDNDELLKVWRPLIVRPANLLSLDLNEPAAGPAEQSIRLRVRGSDINQLADGADALIAELQTIDGVSDLSSSFALGNETLTYETRDYGRALGFSDESLGTQLRGALTGVTAYRFLEGEREIPVRLVYGAQARSAGFEDQIRVKSASGTFANLSDVAEATESRGISSVRRFDGQINVRISGDLDQAATSLGDFQSQVRSPAISELLATYGAELGVAGQAAQQEQFFADLSVGALIGLLSIFVVLAWVFASYTRPLIVMAVIPFGIVGAVVGHWLLDMPLSILSYISIFGLSGIVVNDSIVLVSRIDERAQGENIFTAIAGAAADRLRAVLLTSLTTIGGLLPLLFETSLQAQFLIPMAVTVVFGLGFSTVLILVFVPALVGIQADLGLAGKLAFMTTKPLKGQLRTPRPAPGDPAPHG